MRRTTPLLLLGALTLAVGCSGEVIPGPGNLPGSGNGGAGGAGAPSSSTSTPSTSSSPNIDDLCDEVCAELQGCVFPEDGSDSCVPSCREYGESCRPEQETFHRCLLDTHQGACAFEPGACATERDAFISCAGTNIHDSHCEPWPDGGCWCETSANTGDLYESTCQVVDDHFECFCTINTTGIARCTQETDDICVDAMTNCCGNVAHVTTPAESR